MRGGHGLAGARDRYRLHRPGAPGGAAAVGRGGIAAGGAGRSPGGRATPRCHLPGGADPPGGRRRRRRGDAGRDDRAHRPGDQRAGRPGPADGRRGERRGPDGRWLVRHRHTGGALRLTAASGLRVGADAAVRRLLLGGPVRLLAEDRVGPRHRPAQRPAERAAAGRDVVGHDPGPGHVPGGSARGGRGGRAAPGGRARRGDGQRVQPGRHHHTGHVELADPADHGRPRRRRPGRGTQRPPAVLAGRGPGAAGGHRARQGGLPTGGASRVGGTGEYW